MTVLTYYQPTPEGSAALRAALDASDRLDTGLSVYNAPGAEVFGDHRSLDDTVADAKRRNVKIELLRAGSFRQPVDELIEASQTNDVDLVVIGIRDRSPVGKILLGSVEQTILLEVPAPVLAVKASSD